MLPGLDGAVLSGVQLNPARYPYIYRNESVVSVYSSVTGPVSVPDPYRWLEDTSSKPTRDSEFLTQLSRPMPHSQLSCFEVVSLQQQGLSLGEWSPHFCSWRCCAVLQAQKDVYDSWSYAKVNGRSAGDYAVRNTLANLTIPAPTCPTGFATDSVSGSTGSVM